jgi:hypothetical protein
MKCTKDSGSFSDISMPKTRFTRSCSRRTNGSTPNCLIPTHSIPTIWSASLMSTSRIGQPETSSTVLAAFWNDVSTRIVRIVNRVRISEDRFPLRPIPGSTVASVFADLSNNLERPSFEGFAEIPDKSASLPAALSLLDVIRVLDTSSGLFHSVAPLHASDRDVTG